MRALAAILITVLALGTPAAADVFTIRGVEVDQTAGSATEAREVAVAAGQLAAAQRLIERITLPEDRGLVPPIDSATASRLVSGFQVEEESASGRRYLGRLTVAFDGDAVRQLLDNYGVPYILSSASPAVVVPLWQDETGVRLWENNPWLEAWTIAGTADELVPVIAPSGDLADISALDANSAVTLNFAALEKLASNYGSRRVVVVLASPTATPGQITAPRMAVIDFATGAQPQDYGSLGTGAPVDLAHAAAALLQRDWKQTLVVRDPTVHEAPTTSVLYSSLNEWLDLYDVIRSEPLVQTALAGGLTNSEGVVTLRYRGTPEQLELALRERGAKLIVEPNGNWTIVKAGGAADDGLGQ